MLWCLSLGEKFQRLQVADGSAGTNIWEEICISHDGENNAQFDLLKMSYRQGLTQLNANEFLIFGGEDMITYNETKATFIVRVDLD